jgi:hypothetical protein
MHIFTKLLQLTYPCTRQEPTYPLPQLFSHNILTILLLDLIYENSHRLQLLLLMKGCGLQQRL